jgi:arginase
VSDAISSGAFPVVLAGNCNAEVGMYAGQGSPDVDLVWFDGHTDFYTPDTLDGGYFDSMGAATLTGLCWRRLAATVPGFSPLDPRRLIYCGSRHLEVELESRILAAGARMVKGGEEKRSRVATELTQVLGAKRAKRLIHLDVDCLDPSEGWANQYAEPGGLMGDDLMDCLEVVLDRSEIIGLTVASYDPQLSGSERIGEIAIDAIHRVAASA